MSRSVYGASPRLSLRLNFSWSLVGNAAYAGSQWGMLVVLAKLGSPAKLGQFALGFAISAPVIMFANLQLRAVQTTDARREFEFADYFGLRLITTTLALLVIAALVAGLGYRGETALVVLAVGLAKALESISDVFYGLQQHHEQMDRIARSMIVKGLLSLVALSGAVYATGSVLCGVVALAVAWALVMVWYDVPNGAALLSAAPGRDHEGGWLEARPGVLWPRFEPRTLRHLTWLTLPLGAVMMLISLNVNIPRYFVERFLGQRELGIYAALAYVLLAGDTVVNALGQSASPRLAKYYAAGDATAFRRLLLKLVAVGALLGTAGLLVPLVAGRQLLTLLYRPEYGDYAGVFVWMMTSAGVAYVASFLGHGMTAARHFRVQAPLFAAVTGSAAAAGWWLIPRYGLQGAAMTMIVAAVLQAGGAAAVTGYALRTLSRRAVPA